MALITSPTGMIPDLNYEYRTITVDTLTPKKHVHELDLIRLIRPEKSNNVVVNLPPTRVAKYWRSTNATGCHGCHAWSRLGAPEPHGDFQATHRPPRSTAVPCLPLGRLVPPPLAGRAVALFFLEIINYLFKINYQH